MHVISRKKLLEFGVKQSDVKGELDTWYYMITKNTYPEPNAIKESISIGR